MHTSVSDSKIEKDNGIFNQYSNFYQIPFRNNSFLNSDDVFSHAPMDPLFMGTGPGAINDNNFMLNNQRKGNYQKNPSYFQGNNYSNMNMNTIMNTKRDSNYRPANSFTNNQNSMHTNANQQQPQQHHYSPVYPSAAAAMMMSNGLNQMNQRELSNLPPRFQKQIKPQNNSPFQSFMRNQDVDRNSKLQQDKNNLKYSHSFNKLSGNTNSNISTSNNSFNKFINQSRLNGSKNESNLVNELNQIKINDEVAFSGNSTSLNTDVNIFLEVEKLLSDFYATENYDPIINFLKTTTVNFDEILIPIMRISVSKSEKERDLTNKLINKIKLDSIISETVFLAALKILFEKISELEVESPRARSNVAGFVANAIIENVFTLKDIGDLLDGGQHYPLFPLILQNLHKAKGQAWLFDIFTESKIQLMNMVPENDRNKERMADILEDRNLTFLYPMLRIESDITRQITSDCTPNSLYKWLKDNVTPPLQESPEFITVVFSTLLKHIINKHNNVDNPFVFTSSLFAKQDEELKKFSQVLQIYLNGHTDLQLIVLYSLQTFCHDHNFPKGLIEKWFNMLYEHEIVDEEVFYKWREDINDEYPGKGKALFQVNKWLTWLAEDDEEDEE